MNIHPGILPHSTHNSFFREKFPRDSFLVCFLMQVDKHHDQKKHGEERVVVAYMVQSQSLIDADAGTLEE